MMEREQSIKQQLRLWISQCQSEIKAEDILDTTPLIADKLISSVQVLDLILYLEHLGAEELNPEKLNPKSFQSIQSIYENFFC